MTVYYNEKRDDRDKVFVSIHTRLDKDEKEFDAGNPVSKDGIHLVYVLNKDEDLIQSIMNRMGDLGFIEYTLERE